MSDGPSFVKLPRAVLRDPDLSAGAKIAYVFLCEASYRDHRQRVSRSMAELAEDLGKSPDAARRLVRELKTAKHVDVLESPPGKKWTFHLAHSTDAPPSKNARGSELAPLAETRVPSGTNARGTPGENAPTNTYKRNSLNVFSKKRTYGNEEEEPSGELIELLMYQLGWPAEKIRNEAATLYRQIGGRANEATFIAEVRSVMLKPKIRKPLAYALGKMKRLASAA